MLKNTDDLRIKTLQQLLPPAILMEELPITTEAANITSDYRHQISKILHGRDDRLLVVVGPCSIHDPKAALEYAAFLAKESPHLQQDLCLIMRVYFEKPRTTIGWKGLINDPGLDNSFDINLGLRTARQLLLNIAHLGVPAGTEFLDTMTPQYISDVIAWGAIGARTTESQIHRELASGLSMPIGFKNGTNGDIQIAIDAIRSARHSHHFLGVNKFGLASIVATTGNDTCHVILRGANHGPNYDDANITHTVELLKENDLHPYLMVDCSHGNSYKDYKRQADVVESLCQQISAGSKPICGAMLESNLVAGKQPLQHGNDLVYGQSVTDGCIDWKETKVLLHHLAEAVRKRRKLKHS